MGLPTDHQSAKKYNALGETTKIQNLERSEVSSSVTEKRFPEITSKKERVDEYSATNKLLPKRPSGLPAK